MGEHVPADIQNLDFIFTSSEQYGADVQQNLTNLSFYKSVIEWITEQNAIQNFPQIDEGTVKAIIPTLTPYVANAGSSSAKYQIQIKMTYKRNR